MQREKNKPEALIAEGVIEALGARGEGVLTIDGRTIYIPATAPGDRVKFSHAGERGELLEVLEPGPARVAAPCPHFGLCGGCALQHVDEDTYSAFKIDLLRNALRARGIEAEFAPLSRVPLHSRRRATFGFTRHVKNVQLGFHGGHSHDLEPIDECLVLVPQIVAALEPIRSWLATVLPDNSAGTLHVTACENGLDIDLILSKGKMQDNATMSARLSAGPQGVAMARLTLDGDMAAQNAPPLISFGGVAVRLATRSFLQPTREGEALLQDWVSEGVGAAKRVCDLFSGLGTFALPLARKACVQAVDVEAAPLAELSATARHLTGIKPITTLARDLMRAPLQAAEMKYFDAVVFDPPRAGAAAQAEQIALSRVPRVVAVSCNPATFARDARILIDAGFALDWLRPLDQFLYSAHIELAAQFSRR